MKGGSDVRVKFYQKNSLNFFLDQDQDKTVSFDFYKEDPKDNCVPVEKLVYVGKHRVQSILSQINAVP